MDARLNSINSALRRFDEKLYAEKDLLGKITIYRKAYRFLAYEFQGERLLVSHPNPYMIFPLTDDWSAKGKSVEWGVEPILSRLQAIDAWNRARIHQEYLEQHEKVDAAADRDFKNNTEAFLKDFRRPFAKAFNDINTSTLEKRDSRRDYERKMKNGYR